MPLPEKPQLSNDFHQYLTDVDQWEADISEALEASDWSPAGMRAEGGPMGQLADPSKVDRIDAPVVAAAVRQAQANVHHDEAIKGGAGEDIEPGRASVYSGKREHALHEALHLRRRTDVERKDGEFGNRRHIPEAEGFTAGGAAEHPWMEANEIFDARTEAEYDEAVRGAAYVPDDLLEEMLMDQAGDEYDLGARLQYDPRRGHGAGAVAQSAMESVGNERNTYRKYRNRQSWLMQQ